MKKIILFSILSFLTSCFLKEKEAITEKDKTEIEQTTNQIDSTQIKKVLTEFQISKSELQEAINSLNSKKIDTAKINYEKSLNRVKTYSPDFIDATPPSASKKQKMEIAYNKAEEINTVEAWRLFLDKYPEYRDKSKIEDRIIRLEVDEIFNDEKTGEMPAADKIGNSDGRKSSIEIENRTNCTLTLRYSGTSTKMINIPSSQIKNIALPNGNYRVTASACGANYAGIENLNGNYSVYYYITTTYR